MVTPASAEDSAQSSHVDVLIIGAGLSGIGAGCHLARELPDRSYTILEARERSGGTWDLFRYPGVRSDSDMYTLGYRFKPWLGDKALADGPSILDYVRRTGAEYGVDEHIRYRHTVVGADWSSADQQWTVTADHDGTEVTFTAGVLWSCSGYYDYDSGYQPDFPGLEDFEGTFVHPQHWPEDLDYADKDVVIIGSGATAVTLVPAMAETAHKVTMLQRSPTYILPLPGRDPIANGLRKVLPAQRAYDITRWKNVLQQSLLYKVSQARPALVRRLVRTANVKSLPDGYDVDTHFKPKYDPWDQRLCVVPDGDLFKAIGKGTAEVVTDSIASFTPKGILLASGEELQADIVVSATGLNLKIFGGATLSIDGRQLVASQTMAYKGMLLSDVPNFAFTIGYTNASWTLKADLVAEYLIRLLRHLDETGAKTFVARRDPSVREEPLMDLASGYVLRSIDAVPRQGDKAPWKLRQDYVRDVLMLRRGPVTDEAMSFT